MNQKNFSQRNSTQARPPKPLKTNEFDPKKLTWTELDFKSERAKGASQVNAFPRYKNLGSGSENLLFQVDWIQLTQYGMPKSTDKDGNPSKWYSEDEKRAFIKLVLDPNQTTCVELKKFLEKLDYEAENNAINPAIKKKRKLDYSTLVRMPVEYDDEDDDDDDDVKQRKKPSTVRQPYCKIKFDLDYNTKNLKTRFYLKSPGSSRPELLKCKTASDLDEYLKWNCKCRMIVMVNKLWAAKLVDKKTDTRGYGLGMKALQIEIEPIETSSSITEQFSQYAFRTNDDETNPLDASNDSDNDNDVIDNVKDEEVEADDDEDDEDNEAEEEADDEEELDDGLDDLDDDLDDDEVIEESPEEPVPVVKKKVVNTKNKKVSKK